ncbi:MAG: Asp23/Gls24 family envelope stress response protein [Thermotogaceae bacterium]|nr:Asp23/Gls24 family envelope stress response protein [Thermotogaceae bacterium]
MAEKGFGNIEISDSVIKEIAVRSVSEFLEISEEKSIKKVKKSLSVQREPEGSVVVNLKIDVPYGEPIPDYVSKLMEKLKNDIERMTELTVEAVNVTVEDIFEVPKEEEQEVQGETSEETEESEKEDNKNE